VLDERSPTKTSTLNLPRKKLAFRKSFHVFAEHGEKMTNYFQVFIF